MRLCASIAVLVGGSLALAAAPAGAVVVYTCGGNLCRINSNGSGQKQLTTDAQPGTSMVYGGPSLTRDGTKLAFAFNSHIYVSGPDATGRSAPIGTTALVALMRPDGGQLAELEQTLTVPPIQLCTYNPDGSGRNCPYGVPSAGWAPDDNFLISVSAGAPNFQKEICHVSAAANQACSDVRADNPSADLYDPAVSPDGSTLAVTVANGIGGSVSGHIALYNYTTGQFERNLTTGTTDDHPAWSPDGSQIAFQRGDDSIYVIGLNGAPGSEHLLAAGAEPTWGGPDIASAVTLTVAKSGSGAGTVTSSPAGIACGSTCSGSFAASSQVTLTAAASPGSRFVGWSGGGCDGTGSCTVTLTGATTVTAGFASGSGAAAPNTVITKRKISKRAHRAQFSFKAVGAATTRFECALTKAHGHASHKPKFSACSSPKAYKHLAQGSYTFRVRAVGQAGTDQTPAGARFKV